MVVARRGDVFGAIADPTRREILSLLSRREHSVTALKQHFPVSRTAVAKHLTVLKGARLVVERKVGRERRYRLEAGPLREVHDWAAFYERFWTEKLEALDRHLESNP